MPWREPRWRSPNETERRDHIRYERGRPCGDGREVPGQFRHARAGGIMSRRAKPPKAEPSPKDPAIDLAAIAAIPFEAATGVSAALGTRTEWLATAEGQ
jgi:hypothetical protein